MVLSTTLASHVVDRPYSLGATHDSGIFSLVADRSKIHGSGSEAKKALWLAAV